MRKPASCKGKAVSTHTTLTSTQLQVGVPGRFLKISTIILKKKTTHPFNSSGILNLTKYLQEHNFQFENDLSDGEKKHEDEASYMAASERKLTHKQEPEEVLMNLSREDQRKNRHEWVEAECAGAYA